MSRFLLDHAVSSAVGLSASSFGSSAFLDLLAGFSGSSAFVAASVSARSTGFSIILLSVWRLRALIGRVSTIETLSPGATELKEDIEKIYKTPTRINIEEVKKPDLYAKLVAENIAHQLERRISFRRAIKSTAASTMRAGAKGVRIEVAGRLNGAEMSRREKEVAGSVPLHTIRANIDYTQIDARTVAGIIGVKVWIYKGEVQ